MFVCTFNGIHGEQVVFLVTCWLFWTFFLRYLLVGMEHVFLVTYLLLWRLVSWLPVGCYGACFLGYLFVIMELVVLDNCLLLWSFFLGYLLVVMGLCF